MRKQRHPAILIERDQVGPNRIGVAGKIVPPVLLALLDLLRPDRVGKALRLGRDRMLHRDFQARRRAEVIEGVQHEQVQHGDEGHHRLIGERIPERKRAGRGQVLDEPFRQRPDLAVVLVRLLNTNGLAVDRHTTAFRGGLVAIVTILLDAIAFFRLHDRLVFRADEAALDSEFAVAGQRDEGAAASDILGIEDKGSLIQRRQLSVEIIEVRFRLLRIVVGGFVFRVELFEFCRQGIMTREFLLGELRLLTVKRRRPEAWPKWKSMAESTHFQPSSAFSASASAVSFSNTSCSSSAGS